VPIPDFQTLMLPVLEVAGDGNVHSLGEARERLTEHFRLTEQELNERLPSGRQRRFNNRVAWAKAYLEQARLLTTPRRGHFQITERGKSVLQDKPSRVDISYLERFPEFQEFRNASRKEDSLTESAAVAGSASAGVTPEELLETAFQSIRTELVSELLLRMKAASPAFFENLVVELLLKMGYGGNRVEAGRAIGGSGDEGIDGIINEDRLGLDIIYIQAKRWDGSVGRPEIQKFVGALHGKRAKKRVFITTGIFTSEARDYVSHIDPRVVLLDGRSLAEFMLDLNIGVMPRAVYELKRIDSDYFTEE
jgi:restriction system protein